MIVNDFDVQETFYKVRKDGVKKDLYVKGVCCLCGETAIRMKSAIKRRKHSCIAKKYTGEISGSKWNNIYYGAVQRKIPFEITPEYAWDLFVKQERKCALSGLPLTLPKSNREFNTGFTNASLDRINSSIGYIEGNVQWVDKDVNMMKQYLEQGKFIGLCKKIALTNS